MASLHALKPSQRLHLYRARSIHHKAAVPTATSFSSRQLVCPRHLGILGNWNDNFPHSHTLFPHIRMHANTYLAMVKSANPQTSIMLDTRTLSFLKASREAKIGSFSLSSFLVSGPPVSAASGAEQLRPSVIRPLPGPQLLRHRSTVHVATEHKWMYAYRRTVKTGSINYPGVPISI
ncbi:unnamed protein product [Protopolystoma xenopodis]|uniref:Uncharacterized protein n=1 Tax=Protopolystoma xenopodis TaxID=117903 RepID=A0A448WIL3_9PLAT|nr:unnamed protein product [Protopolystoma xenopodis]